MKAFITGLAGLELRDDERAFLRAARPCGLILFDRNIDNPEQLRRLIGDYREAVQEEAQLILIDQEGGRIQRMRPPHWRAWPAPARYGRLYETEPQQAIEAAWLVYRLICAELVAVGVNVDCVPLLDVPVDGAHEVIGDRAFSRDIEAIIALGRAVADGCLDSGVLPVIKHMPGHGRAQADSHLALPVIDTPRRELEASDFLPFKALKDQPLGMTGHLLLRDIDPQRNVSVSARIIGEIIRGWIGFDGLLMSDDLSMEALSGTIGQRAADVVAAGCDVALYCKGRLAQMEDVAANVPDLAGNALLRFQKAAARIAPPRPFDRERAENLLRRLETV